MNLPTSLFAFLPGVHPMEMIVVGGIAILLFGKNLPNVARNMGKSLNTFRKSFQGIQDELRGATSSVTSYSPYSSTNPINPSQSRFNEIDDRDEATAPKFEPPPSEPTASKVDL